MSIYGYKIENGIFKIDAIQSVQVKEIYNLYLEGKSLRELAQQFGFGYSHTRVKSILMNRTYLGNEFYPPLIDTSIFETVQKLIIERTTPRKKLSKQPPLIYSDFFMKDSDEKKIHKNLFERAEYLYSLIQGGE